MSGEKETITCPICGQEMGVEKGQRVAECIIKGPLRFHSFSLNRNGDEPIFRKITEGIESDLVGIDREVEEIFNK